MVDSISCAYVCVFRCFPYPQSACVESDGFVKPTFRAGDICVFIQQTFHKFESKEQVSEAPGNPSSPGPLDLVHLTLKEDWVRNHPLG